MEATGEAKVRTRPLDPLSFVDPAAVAEALLADARETLAASKAALEMLEERAAGRIE